MPELFFALLAGARRQWSTTAFRWLSIYALGFALSVMALIGYVGYSVTATMERGTDTIMHWQQIYFAGIDDRQLAATIDATFAKEKLHVDYYGLFGATGRHLAGSIVELPASLHPGSAPVRLRHGVRVQGDAAVPVLQAYASMRPDGSTLVIARDITHLLSIRSTLFYILIAGGALCLAASLACATLLSTRQLRRVNDIHRITLQIAGGDMDQRLPEGGGDELAMQSKLINHMLGQLARLMGEVKGACDGIAHDLRTPLSHVRTLLRQGAARARHHGDAATLELIEQASDETEVLLGRFRAMMRISEIDALQRRSGFAGVDVVALVAELVDLYEPLAQERAIRLVLHSVAAHAIEGDRALLFEAFSNILDNAIKFSPDARTVQVAVVVGPHGSTLSISDEGPGIAPVLRSAVLQRFYRAPQAQDHTGAGLGLSIVAAVVGLHDFALVIGSAGDAAGACVSIELWPHTLA